jgi:hypothetical protein
MVDALCRLRRPHARARNEAGYQVKLGGIGAAARRARGSRKNRKWEMKFRGRSNLLRKMHKKRNGIKGERK